MIQWEILLWIFGSLFLIGFLIALPLVISGMIGMRKQRKSWENRSSSEIVTPNEVRRMLNDDK